MMQYPCKYEEAKVDIDMEDKAGDDDIDDVLKKSEPHLFSHF